ncbi:MAG: hypothetical protein Q4B31_02020 [Clostridia bacterium]|nr:hypothetical protein [Clostridia bacterium]
MKKLFSVVLAVVLAFTMVMPVAFAEEKQDIGFSYGEPIAYAPTLTESHTELSLTSWEDGRPIVLVSADGGNERITSVIDINKAEVIHEFHHDWGGYAYNGTVSDDGVMYFGSYKSLAKYDPRTKELTEFAKIPVDQWSNYNGVIVDNEREAIFATESSAGLVMRIDENTGELKILADMSKDGFVNGSQIGQVGDYIYVSGDSADKTKSAHMWKVHKDTGEYTMIENPTDKFYTGIGRASDIGKYVFAMFSAEDGSIAHVYDTEKEEWTDVTFNYKTSMVSEKHDGKRAFLWDNCIHTIDENLNIVKYPDQYYTSHLRGTGPWVELDDPELPGYSFLTAQFNGNIYIYNLEAKAVKKLDVMLTGTPLQNRISYINPMDDILYVGGFKAGFMACMDTNTGKIQYLPSDQPEGMTHDPKTGMFYHGDYSGAHIYEVDSSKQFGRDLKATAENGKRGEYAAYYFGTLGYDQDRPFDIEIVGRELYTGTLVSGGNPNGGALSVVNLDTGDMQVFQDFVEDHSVITITQKDGVIYGTTTVTKNISAEPAKGAAKIFTFDTKTKEFTKIVDFKVDGIDGNISSVHALEFAPDGRLFGWTHGIFFELAPETLEVKRANVYNKDGVFTDVGFGEQLWHEKKIYFDESGYMVMDGDVIDMETLSVVVSSPKLDGENTGFFAGFDSKGDAWFVAGNTTPYKVPVTRSGDNKGIYFKTGDDKIYVNGETKPFTSYEENGKVMVPMRAFAGIIGGEVGYFHPDRLATLKNAGGQLLSFYARTEDVLIEGADAGFQMTATDGVSYIPFDAMCNFLGKKATTNGDMNYVD